MTCQSLRSYLYLDNSKTMSIGFLEAYFLFPWLDWLIRWLVDAMVNFDDTMVGLANVMVGLDNAMVWLVHATASLEHTMVG